MSMQGLGVVRWFGKASIQLALPALSDSVAAVFYYYHPEMLMRFCWIVFKISTQWQQSQSVSSFSDDDILL